MLEVEVPAGPFQCAGAASTGPAIAVLPRLLIGLVRWGAATAALRDTCRCTKLTTCLGTNRNVMRADADLRLLGQVGFVTDLPGTTDLERGTVVVSDRDGGTLRAHESRDERLSCSVTRTSEPFEAFSCDLSGRSAGTTVRLPGRIGMVLWEHCALWLRDTQGLRRRGWMVRLPLDDKFMADWTTPASACRAEWRGLKKYESGPAVDMTVGGVTTLAGPAGLGKPMLLHLIGAVEATDDGVLRVDDVDVTSLHRRRLAARPEVGLVLQYCHPLLALLTQDTMLALVMSCRTLYATGWTGSATHAPL